MAGDCTSCDQPDTADAPIFPCGRCSSCHIRQCAPGQGDHTLRPDARAELLRLMTASPDVLLRGRGVIGTWLTEQTEIPDVIEAADELIKAMFDAGLVTMIKTDLDEFIQAVRAGRKK